MNVGDEVEESEATLKCDTIQSDNAQQFSDFSSGSDGRAHDVDQGDEVKANLKVWKQDQTPLFIELCSGCGILSATVASQGFDVMPVDHQYNKHRTHVKTFSLDLTERHSWQILRYIVEECCVIAVHIAPPCGTCSRS